MRTIEMTAQTITIRPRPPSTSTDAVRSEPITIPGNAGNTSRSATSSPTLPGIASHHHRRQDSGSSRKMGISPPVALPALPALNFDNPALDYEPPPDKVIASYENDLNIIKIHEAIRTKFACRYSTLPQLLEKIDVHQAHLDGGSLTRIETAHHEASIAELRREYDELKSGSLWQQYVTAAAPLLCRYAPLASSETRGIVTISVNARISEDSCIVMERVRIIAAYVVVAAQYIDCNIHHVAPPIDSCPWCGLCFDIITHDEESGINTCDCGFERLTMSRITSYNDATRVDVGDRNGYEDLSTFIKRMDAYEGQQDYAIPDLLIVQLDEYFVSRGFPSSADIIAMPLNGEGHKDRTSIALLIDGLIKTNNTAFYKDMELIAHRLWGWPLDQISDIRAGMIADYKATQRVYEIIKERDSSLNINLRLFWHLAARGRPVQLCNFKIVTSRESLEYHSRMFRVMCEKTGVKFTPII